MTQINENSDKFYDTQNLLLERIEAVLREITEFSMNDSKKSLEIII